MIPRPLAPVLLLAALSGCGWNHLPQQHSVSIEPLWDAVDVVPTTDGLYVRLPKAGALALLEGERYRTVDLGAEGRVARIDAAPDQRTVVAFVERYRCTSDDPKVIRRADLPSDCPADDLEVTTEVSLVSGGKLQTSQPLSGAYNQLVFSRDARFAIAYLDLSQELEVDAVLNLTGVVVIDLEQSTSQLVSVGFAADRILFVEDDTGSAVQAVVVSRNQVALVDLSAEPPQLDVTFPLTLDPDTIVDPVGIDLTPDGRYALISTRQSSDLYAIDLDVHAIDIKELAGVPGAMKVNHETDRTVFVYPSLPLVQMMDHAPFAFETFDLDEPMSEIAMAGEQAVLWSPNGSHDLYRIDTTSNALPVEYRLQNPPTSIHLAPTHEFALVLTRPEGGSGTGVDGLYDVHPGMEVIDLRSDRSEPFLLEGQGLGVAFAQNAEGTTLNALILQQDIDYLFRLDLYTRVAEEIELDAPPVAIGSMPDGTFYITHDRALGLVSFLDPSSGEVTTVSGFASAGVLDPIALVEEEAP